MTFQAKSVPWNETPLSQLLESSAGSKTAPIETPDNTVSMEVEGVTAKNSTTEFVDDHVMVVKDESHITHVDYSLTKMLNTQSNVASVTDYLNKPIVLTSGSFALTDTFSIFNTFSMPYAAFQASSALLWRQKLAGFFGIRMDMRFRLVVNANKFQQGRYMLGWTATGGNTPVTSNLKALRYLHAHNATLVQRTTVPHVELDLATQSVAEILIPYASVRSYYPLNSVLSAVDRYGLGFISLYPYDPLLAPTGSTTCGYTLYVSLENVELYGASSAQGGLSKREVSNKNNGPISGVAGAISRGFREFSSIPLIGEYAKGVSWIADRISNTAAIFGFSKPTAGDCIPKMCIVNAPSHTTVDGDSDSRTLSFLNQPGVVPLKGLSGIDYDEMDFSFIKSKYAWFRTVPWVIEAVVGTVITDIDVTPLTGTKNIIADGYDNFSYAPVTFLSKQFRYWRGSLKFKFKIVKTEYHSGRLQFAFFPTDDSVIVADAAYVNRIIVDIREHSEIELVIPFIHTNPWMITDLAKVGILRVTVVDPLVAPASVSPVINILIEIAGGEDFETAGPEDFNRTATVLTPQGLDGPRTEENIYSSVIGSAVVNSDPNIMSGLTIGDKVSSVRAFLKRFTPVMKIVSNETTMNVAGVVIAPDIILFATGTTAAPGDHTFAGDTLSAWASCYTFMSGGIRIRDVLDFGMTTGTSQALHTSVQASLSVSNTNQNSMILDSSNAGDKNNHRIIQDCFNNNTVTVEVPQYTPTFARNMVDMIHFQQGSNTSSSLFTFGTNTPYRVNITAPLGTSIGAFSGHTFHRIFRAAADDFNLSGFVSIPPFRNFDSSTNLAFY